MKPPDCTSRALRSFLEAPPGEPARAAFGAFTETARAEEKRDAADARQIGLPGFKVKPAQVKLIPEIRTKATTHKAWRAKRRRVGI